MAYQAKQRDPIFDSTTQAVLERRGKELLGIGLIALGIIIALILGSYSPEDPGWMSATDTPAQNALGRFGAFIASPLSVIAGLGSWALPLVLVVWGLRMTFHFGEERAVGRLIFAPIAVALCSVYASTLVPGAGWTHSFGLGGLFGDTVLGALLAALPVSAGAGLKVMSALAALAALTATLFVLGLDKPEVKRIGQFLVVGVVMTYAGIVSLLGKSAKGAAIGAAATARHMQARHAARKEQQLAQDDAEELFEEEFSAPPPLRTARVLRPEPPMHAEPEIFAQEELAAAPAPQKQGLLASLMRRNVEPEPELVEPAFFEGEIPEELGGEDRIRAKIASALKNRSRQAPIANPMRAEPPLERAVSRHRRSPDPMILDTSTPAEPDMTVPMEDPAMDIYADPYAAPLAEAPMVEAPMMDAPMAAHMMDETPLAAQPEDNDLIVEDLMAPAVEPEARVYTPQHSGFTQPAKKVVQHPPKKPVQPSTRAKAEAQPALKFEDAHPGYELPPLNLLANPASIERHVLSDEALEENARMLEVVLDDYGVKGEIVSVRPGPVVTMYELEPAPGLKASRVIGLADDIARSMSALSARVSTVPGRSVIGIELPNEKREMVSFREILSTRDFGDGNQRLPLALGKDIGGEPVVANLAKMPHLLIAGTTGSGKSVAINTMIMSLLYKLTPEDCRMIMIDPKMLELSVYDGIPHLLSPVVTDPKKAVVALKWVVGEMEERYRKMSKMGVRNIEGYNSRVADTLAKGEMFERTVQTGFDDDTGEPIFETEEFAPEKLPFIVVVVDEMADLMMVAGKEIEACIQRLAQMARASGIHIIMATQRPSVDVITGTIKANFPTRISFQVTSKVDSRTILGEQGAEQLLGMGDMLYMAGGSKITRVHGPFVSDEEVEEIVSYLKSFGPPEYVGGVSDGPAEDKADNIDAVLGLNTGGNTNGEDALYDQAVAIVVKDRKCSTSYIQRKLGIGYNKAARLVEQMEDEGLVSASNHVGKREILIPEQQ
ncbi:DNA translocase FtsK [Aliiroseovarius halocynthiae]|uniref:DNA translocase FtsK n=1 Tax=Aliiroseovarius halocynthiae TaxID=985055 RepID=A0A545SPJ8_9RHOB|nr:DNA translocase FtsK [Aliiroseovarius halocynthiae]TQV66874.1 DNA translocase FtsK [Aliiroseovarius halocynthiae]SMR82286.1 DNA translocase FtsK [Aliiroseovarius halocynthiae]